MNLDRIITKRNILRFFIYFYKFLYFIIIFQLLLWLKHFIFICLNLFKIIVALWYLINFVLGFEFFYYFKLPNYDLKLLFCEIYKIYLNLSLNFLNFVFESINLFYLNLYFLKLFWVFIFTNIFHFTIK